MVNSCGRARRRVPGRVRTRETTDCNDMKTLVIAEKPSVAQDIVKALTPTSGKFEKHDDHFENDKYVVTSAVGHLVEIQAPEQYAGGTKTLDKPVQRLWLQSMTPQAIRDGFDRLRSNQQMQGLADAARSRSEADWLVGINGTRAMTAFNSRDGGFFLTTVGRVQTPTLAVVVEREEQIRKFISHDYWEIHAEFGAAAGTYPGKWFDPKWRKEEDAEKRPIENGPPPRRKPL